MGNGRSLSPASSGNLFESPSPQVLSQWPRTPQDSGSVRFPPIFMGFLALCSSLSTSVCLAYKNPNAFRPQHWPPVLLQFLGPSALAWARIRDSMTPE